MAEAVWNGFLRLSLVSCPIRLSPGTSDNYRIKLDVLSARTGNPVTEQFVDAKTGDVVPKDALVKGYEFEKGRYVTFTEDELAKLGGGAGNVIDLEQFVLRDQIDRIHIKDTYYIHPEGQLAADTVHALRLAMRRGGKAALGHVKIADQERPVMIEPHRGGLMLLTLHTQEELIIADFSERPESDVPAEMVEIAEAIISRRSAEFDPNRLGDRYHHDLQELVEQKTKDAPPAPTPAAAEARRPGAAAPPPPPAAPPPSPADASPPAAAAAPPPPPVAAPPPPPPPPPIAAPPPPPPPVAVPPPPPPPPVEAAPPPPPLFAVASPPAADAPPPPSEPEADSSPEPEADSSAAPSLVETAAPPPPAAAASGDAEEASSAGENANDVGAEILLHIMGLGDRRYVEPGWAGNPGSRRQIEALSVRPREGLAASAVEFRVFAQEGRATAWVSNGNYAGTRGRNLPLTGFAVRPSGEFGNRLQIEYEGSFFEGGVVGPKRNGELCVSSVADDPLEAVRISIVDRGAE